MTARDADIKIAQQVRLKLTSVSPVTVLSTATGHLRFEPNMALVQQQLLPANRIMEVMPNTPFRIFLGNVSSQHIHVPSDMMMGKLCTNLMTIVDLNLSLSTRTEDLTLAKTVSIVQGDNVNTS